MKTRDWFKRVGSFRMHYTRFGTDRALVIRFRDWREVRFRLVTNFRFEIKRREIAKAPGIVGEAVS